MIERAQQSPPAETAGVPRVLAAMHAVAAELAAIGVAKGSRNKQQGFDYRGIDDIMNALAPLLAKHRLLIVPRFWERACEARRTKDGGNIYSVTVRAELHFTSVEDGSVVTAQTFGEGMDMADKATTKAMAIAYKYGVMESLCIPLEGTADPDAHGHEPTTREGQITRADVQALTDDIALRFREASELPELATLFTQAQADVKRYALEQKWERDWLAEALGEIAKSKDKCKKDLQKKNNPPKGDDGPPAADDQGGGA